METADIENDVRRFASQGYTLEADGSFRQLRNDDTDGNFEKPLVVD